MSQKRPRSPVTITDPTPPGGQAPTEGELLPVVKVGRLDTVTDWRRQVGKIFREMRKGTLPADIGTSSTR